MRTYHLSTLIGLTTTVAVYAPPAVQAATFNFDYNQLQLISSRPIASNNILQLDGYPSDNQGYTGFFNLDPSAPDHGHIEIGLNSRGNSAINNAPYYTTGRPGSPEDPPSGATTTASASEITGFPTVSSYLTNNGISPSSIGFNYGQKSDASVTQTWNLGSDTLGVDWLASPDSSIEERIYRANPNNVDLGIYDGTTKIVDLGYSNLYSVLDYGVTPSDDFESNFTDPVTATKVPGLDSSLDGLADAFLKDVTAAGGGVQIVFSEYGVGDLNFATGNGYGIFILPFESELRAVPLAAVPETSSAWGLLMFGALVAVARITQQKKMKTEKTRAAFGQT